MNEYNTTPKKDWLFPCNLFFQHHWYVLLRKHLFYSGHLGRNFFFWKCKLAWVFLEENPEEWAEEADSANRSNQLTFQRGGISPCSIGNTSSIRVHFPACYVSLLEGTYSVGNSSRWRSRLIKKAMRSQKSVEWLVRMWSSISFCGPRWLSEEGASIFDQSCWQLGGSSVSKWLQTMVNKFPK